MSSIDRVTLILRPSDGGNLESILPFAKLGAHVSIGRGLAVIAGASEGDLQDYLEQKLQELGKEREDRQAQAELWEAAIGAPAHLAAHAQEMLDLLHRINVKVGGVNAVINHGGEPSDLMWEEYDATLAAIWELLSKVQNDASVDAGRVNQIAQECENVNQHQDDLEPDLIAIIAALQQKISLMEAPLDIDDRVRMTADARRYRWLRDHAMSTGSGFTPAVFDRAGGIGTARVGEDLDLRIDAAIRSFTQEQVAQEQQP